jgi:hypothetical protein
MTRTLRSTLSALTKARTLGSTIILSSGLWLSGCTYSNVMIFYKPDMTASVYDSDANYCYQQAYQLTRPSGIGARGSVRVCMEERGYRYMAYTLLPKGEIERVRRQWHQ